MSEMHLPRLWDTVGEILLYHCGEWGGKIQPHSHNHNSHLKKYQNVRKSGQLWDLRGYFSCIWENAGRCGNYFTLIFPHFPQKTTHIGWDSHKSFLHSHITWGGNVGRLLWESYVGVGWEKIPRGKGTLVSIISFDEETHNYSSCCYILLN